MTARATLGGKPLLDSAAVAWPLRYGSRPAMVTVEMAPLDATAVSTSGGPVELVIDPGGGSNFGGGNPVRAQNLWVLNVQPGPDPFVSRVTIADRRWMWSYGHILRRYNMRRRTGVKMLTASNVQPAINSTAAQIAYWAWSLKNNVPWTAKDVLEDVLKEVGDIEKEYAGSAPPIKIDGRIAKSVKGIPVEDLQVDDAGDQAVERILAYLPEAACYVDYDGSIVVTSRATGDEEGVLKAILPELVGDGHSDLVENALVRPKEIHVLFTREVEVRFDFLENSSASSTQTALVDERRMENVLPIPDYSLTVNSRTVARGTYLTMDQAFTAWGNLPIIGKSMDHWMIQRAFIPHMDLWAAIGLAGERPNDRGELENWPGRIGAVQQHYRRTFRVNPRWTDRILSMRAYRVSTIDPQSGQRGPAPAFGDYSILYTQRSLWKNIAQGQNGDYVINRTAYPSDGVLGADADLSPAEVSIPDSDQGIVHVDYKPNPVWGMNETILPGQVDQDSMPCADIGNRTRPISFDTVIGGKQPPKLSSSFKLAVIVTCVPSSPNTDQQLHRVVIKPTDVSDSLPASQRTGLSEARGPIMEVRIGAQVETARIAWIDSRATDIEKIFGVVAGDPDLSGLVINEGAEGGGQTGASINAIAKAAAARIYASLVDRYEGGMAGYMNGQVRPAGWLPEVRHELRTNGEAVTVVEMPGEIPKLSLFGWLDSASRAAILRLAQPEA